MSNSLRNKHTRWQKLFSFLRNRYQGQFNLRYADLRYADLSGADLSGADLSGADLRGATLRGVDLSGASLHGASLRGASLRGASLHGVDLSGASLHGADLSYADLSGCKSIIVIYVPDMSSREDCLYAVQHDLCVMIKTGCFWGTLAEFKTKVASEKGTDCSYMNAIEFIEKSTIRLDWSN